MNTPVDLSNLRSMTDGDVEMEKELFNEFYRSFEKGIQILQSSYDMPHAEIWRKEAHALKGIALNLGAFELGALCKQAQEMQSADPLVKEQLVKHIEVEYSSVKQFLQ